MPDKNDLSFGDDLPESEPNAPYSVPSKGFRIGEYTIKETLGHGSMATVFLAEDATGHEVALKVFQEGPSVSRTMLARFQREAEASKKLRKYPNIITIFATGQQGPYHYIAMECVSGRQTFEDAVDSGLTDHQIIDLGIKIAKALHYAHKHRIVHRDVKPSNIMVDEFGEPLLTDFGVAALFDWPSCTVTGALTGTPLYMSPEQAKAEDVGPPADIYSLGVVLYEAFTGELPYEGGRNMAVQNVLEAVRNEPPRRPRAIRKDLSRSLEAVLLKALQKHPRERYLDAETMAIDLHRVLVGRPVLAKRFAYLDATKYYVRKNKTTILVMAMASLVAVLILLVSRQNVTAAKFDGLLHQAHSQNAEYALVLEKRQNVGSLGQTSQAWNEIRLARKAMMSGDWVEASRGFQLAHSISSQIGDYRTSAIARLDQARCETMQGHKELALDFYKWVVRNKDTSPSISSIAQLEYLTLALLSGDEPKGMDALLWKALPEDGPFREAIDGLRKEISLTDLNDRIGNMPKSFQNDARFVIGVRSFLDGEREKAAKALKRCITESQPASDWPSPYARQLYSTIAPAP